MKQLLIIIGIIGLLIVFASVPNESGAGVRCDLCGNEIEGKYIHYKNNYVNVTVCMNCNSSKPRCDACNIPFNALQLRYHKGERICSPCLQHAKYCNFCDTRIKGTYFYSKESSEYYCQRCYQLSPKCVICNRPTHVQHLDKESGACMRCLPTLQRCTACNKAITGQYYKIQFTEGVFCVDCKNFRDKCYTCGVPVGEQYWRFPDGRTICSKCNEKIIIDRETITEIMKNAENLVRKHVGLDVKRPYELSINQRNQLSAQHADLAKKGNSSESPLFGEELGLYRSRNGKSEIFLLYGLPEEMLYETAAHEFAHAWQAENCPIDQSAELREGFAQWVAAQVLRVKGFKTTLAKLEARHDSPYGTGYNRVKELHRRLGVQRLLEYLKEAKM